MTAPGPVPIVTVTTNVSGFDGASTSFFIVYVDAVDIAPEYDKFVALAAPTIVIAHVNPYPLLTSTLILNCFPETCVVGVNVIAPNVAATSVLLLIV